MRSIHRTVPVLAVTLGLGACAAPMEGDVLDKATPAEGAALLERAIETCGAAFDARVPQIGTDAYELGADMQELVAAPELEVHPTGAQLADALGELTGCLEEAANTHFPRDVLGPLEEAYSEYLTESAMLCGEPTEMSAHALLNPGPDKADDAVTFVGCVVPQHTMAVQLMMAYYYGAVLGAQEAYWPLITEAIAVEHGEAQPVPADTLSGLALASRDLCEAMTTHSPVDYGDAAGDPITAHCAGTAARFQTLGVEISTREERAPINKADRDRIVAAFQPAVEASAEAAPAAAEE